MANQETADIASARLAQAHPATNSKRTAAFFPTLGGGFVWKLRGNLYLNPWAAGHLLLSRPEVTLYGATWKPGALTGEVSLKVGWYTSL